MIYGYARVSTGAQDLTSQLAQLKGAGCEKVFREKLTGTTADRPQLQKLITKLAYGDVVIIPAVDRLSRDDTTDLLIIAREMQKAGAGIRSLAEPFLDTTSDFAEIVFAILGVAAKLERRRILDRTARGRADAKAKGVKFGRKPTLTPHQQKRGDQAARRGRRNAALDSPQLQCQPADDFEALCVSKFAARGWLLALSGFAQHVARFTEQSANRLIATGTIVVALGTLVLAMVSYCGLQDARTTFETGSRAWIAPISIGLTTNLEQGNPIAFGVKYDNVGKLPAVDLHEHYNLSSVPNASIDNGTAMSQIEEDHICRDIEPWKDADVVYPNAGGVKMILTLKPTDPQTGKPTPLYENFMSGDHSLVVHFCIAYKTLNGVHHSEFCYVYRPGVTEGLDFNRCDKGNRAD